MLDFCSKHNITCDIEVISADKTNEAYERVLKSDVRYRFVIDMATLKFITCELAWKEINSHCYTVTIVEARRVEMVLRSVDVL